MNMKKFTPEELERFDGSNGIAYIAYMGLVYDVSKSYYWRKGRHQFMHNAGMDLTEELKKAPHSAELLSRFPVVGELIENPSQDNVNALG